MAKGDSPGGKAPSQRQLRVGELIRRAMAEILSITVSEVRVTPDLRIATAYVLPLGGRNQDEAIQLLAQNKGELRRQITKKLALRFSPDLRFRLDDTYDRMDETRRLFAQEDVRRDLDD